MPINFNRIAANALAAFGTTMLSLLATGLLNTESGWKAVLLSSLATAALVAGRDYQKECEKEELPPIKPCISVLGVF